jgi:hypothetical protein
MCSGSAEPWCLRSLFSRRLLGTLDLKIILELRPRVVSVYMPLDRFENTDNVLAIRSVRCHVTQIGLRNTWIVTRVTSAKAKGLLWLAAEVVDL